MQYGALRSQDRTISISIRRPVCFACGRPKEGSGKETGNDLCYFLFLFLEGSASPSGFDPPLPVRSVLVCGELNSLHLFLDLERCAGQNILQGIQFRE